MLPVSTWNLKARLLLSARRSRVDTNAVDASSFRAGADRCFAWPWVESPIAAAGPAGPLPSGSPLLSDDVLLGKASMMGLSTTGPRQTAQSDGRAPASAAALVGASPAFERRPGWFAFIGSLLLDTRRAVSLRLALLVSRPRRPPSLPPSPSDEPHPPSKHTRKHARERERA